MEKDTALRLIFCKLRRYILLDIVRIRVVQSYFPISFWFPECGMGNGDSGAIFLHKGLLRAKLGWEANMILTKKHLHELLPHIELSIKWAFNLFNDPCDGEFHIPISGTTNFLGLGVEYGYFTLLKFINSCTLFNSIIGKNLSSGF